MNILLLAPQPFLTQRGTPLATKMLLESLSRRGYKTDVMVYAEGEDVSIERCRVFRLPAIPGLGNIGPGFSVKKLVLDAVMFPMVAWRLWKEKYDLIIAVEESAYIACVLKPFFRTPYVFDVDSSIPEQIADKFDPPRWITGFLEKVEAIAARKAMAAMACCKSLKETVQGYAPDLEILVLEDVTMLAEPETAEVPADLPTDLPVIMYVGNLETYQGVGLLIDAFAQVDQTATPARLVIIGGSEDHISEYKDRAGKLGLSENVSFLGPRPVDQLSNYLKGATITASPRTQGRNTPMKVYSYLDSGRPLLATDLQTHTQVLDDEISMLTQPEAEDMARGLTELLADKTLRDRIGSAARIRVAECFSPQAYEAKVDTFFQTVIEPRLEGLSQKKSKVTS